MNFLFKLQYLQKNSNRFYLTGIVLFAIAFVYWPIIFSASGDIRIVDAFNTDEVDFLISLLNAYNNGTFEIGHYEYGLLYYNVGLIFFNIVGVFTPITEQVGVVIMRFLSCLFLVGTAMVLRQFAKKHMESAKELVFVLVLFSSATLINYGTMLHPDVAQVFFVALSLFYIADYVKLPSVKSIVLSSLFAGFAFSTKYVGVALLPILWFFFFLKRPIFFKQQSAKTSSILLIPLSVFAAFLANPEFYASYLTPNNEISSSILTTISGVRVIAIVLFFFGLSTFFYQKYIVRIENIKWGAIVSMASSGIFVLAFSAGSAQGIRGFNFLNGIVAVASVHKDGHWFRDETGLWGWLEIIIQPHVVTMVWSSIALIGILVILYQLIRSDKKQVNLILAIPFLWILVFCFVIVFRVKSHFAHYLIPILPFCFIYAAFGLSLFIDKVNNRWLKQYLNIRYSGVIVLGVLLIFSSWKAVEYSNNRVAKFENSPELKAGIWLSENVNKKVFISSDKYTYIPKNENLGFRHYWGLSNEIIRNDNPDYLIINYHTFQWFLKASDVETYLHGREIFLERNTLYHKLLEDKHEQFKLVADFDAVKVFEKK